MTKGVIFFLAFLCVPEHFELIETHFFFENFCEREARNECEGSEQDKSAKPEEVKQPSSPAGLTGRSASRACKLVYMIKIALSFFLSVCIPLAPTVLVQSAWNLASLGPCGWHGVGKVALRHSHFALRAKRVIGQRGKKKYFFFAFLCVSEHFESIETHFFFFSKIFMNFALLAKRVMDQKG